MSVYTKQLQETEKYSMSHALKVQNKKGDTHKNKITLKRQNPQNTEHKGEINSKWE